LKESIGKSGNIRVNTRSSSSSAIYVSIRNNSDDFGINRISNVSSGEERTTAVSLARIFSCLSSSTNLFSIDKRSIVSGITIVEVEIREIN
jgi:hypothetical protein